MRSSPMSIAIPLLMAFSIGSILPQQVRGHDAAIVPVASNFLSKDAPRSLHEGGPLDLVLASNSDTIEMDPASTMVMDKWKPSTLKPRFHGHGQRPGQPTTVADRQLQADVGINRYDTHNTFEGSCRDAEDQYYDSIQSWSGPPTDSIEECATFCQTVGVGHLASHIGFSYSSNQCSCHFESLPADIILPEGVFPPSRHSGTGPVHSGDGYEDYVCYPVSVGVGPWVINFLDVVANFSISSDDELVLNYEVGKGRKVKTFLYKKDCTTNVTDIFINTTVSKTPMNLNLTYELLTVSHNVNKTAIGSSSVWNDTSKQIELCQVVQLKVEDNDMVISEDIREIDINFDLDVDFTITNNTLGAATIEQGNGTTNVGSYLSAVKCSADAFDSDSSPLVPNADLFVCITSVSTDVGIDSIDKMDIAQAEVYDLNVIVDGKPAFSSFTSIEYVSSTKVKVSTRVPLNVFTFEAGASIAISGEVIMKLAGARGRKLQADVGAKEEAIFDLNVNLQPEIVAEEEEVMMNAAASAARKGFVMLGMVFASVYVMW